jgi:hypothetical protein
VTLPTALSAPPDRRGTVLSDAVRRDVRPLGAGGVLLALWMLWIGKSGGYSAETWYPSALGVLSLWVAVLVWGRRVLPENRIARTALLTFAALVALNYLSIVWATSAGSALDAANQLALYLLVAWIFAVLPWTPRALALMLGLWSLGIGVFCAFAVAGAASASSLTLFFVNGRFSTPMQYSNATGALAVMGMWPALILSSRRELPVWLRALGLGLAVFLADFATLPQSRAALLGLVLTAPVALLASSGRIRLLGRMIVVGAALAVVLPRTVSVDNAVSAGGNVTPILRHAADGMLITSIAAVVAGLVLAWLDSHLLGRVEASLTDRVRRAASRIPRVAALAVAVVVIAGVAVAVEPKVDHFVHTVVAKGNTDASTGSDRLLSTSPEERFDYVRVALHLFSGAPVLGIGSGNFGRRYDGLRRFVKHSQYTHNLPLRVLSETGVVGEALFLFLLVTLVVGMARTARRRGDLGRAGAAIALCVSGYFLVHSCLDWVDEFPALAAPAIGLPLAAIGLAGPGPASGAGRGGRAWRGLRGSPVVTRRLAWATSAAGGLLMLVALGTAYLSLRLIDRAFTVARAAPSQAYHDLSVAGSLDPLSANPVTSEGTIALYLGDTSRSQHAFARAIAKEDDWYPRLELALIDADQRRFAPALQEIDRAAVLDVDDPLIVQARALIVRHQRIDPVAFNKQVEQEGNATSSLQPAIR